MPKVVQTSEDDHQRISTEVPFSFEEIFFSRTNEKGHIISGNDVFQRISMYPWDEILHKPHNIIRHSDMPRAVFWLLWDTIKKGNAIGAYVKNKAKDGRYYWVFAIVTPIDGGYLSVRIKPSSPLFSVVRDEYVNLVTFEQDERPKPAASGKVLLDRLEELGFPDYLSFMSAAISQELASRDAHLSRKADAVIECFNELAQSSQRLHEQAKGIFDAYSENAFVPFNLHVQAAQLGNSGATIGVISDNYSILSAEIKERMSEFISSANNVLTSVNVGRFLFCTAKLQRETLQYFKEESSDAPISHDQEIALLAHQEQEYSSRALEGLRAISRQAENFHDNCAEMKRLSAGLEVIRIMGKVESSRVGVTREELDGLIHDLEAFQISVSAGLKKIDEVNRRIQTQIGRLLKNKELAIA